MFLLAGVLALAGAVLAPGSDDSALLAWGTAAVGGVLAIVCLAIASGRSRATPVADGVAVVAFGVALQQLVSGARVRDIGDGWWGVVSLAAVLLMLLGVCLTAGARSRQGRR